MSNQYDENIEDFGDDDIEANAPESYTTSTPSRATNRPAVTAPGAGTGRRKEAVARVRLVPGSGRWTINGRDLASYFPNKVHQQLVSEPFHTVGADGSYDVHAHINGGGISGQAGALRLGVSRALNANGASLIRHSSSDCLTNPPRCICGEFIALCVVKFFNRTNQTKISFLN